MKNLQTLTIAVGLTALITLMGVSPTATSSNPKPSTLANPDNQKIDWPFNKVELAKQLVEAGVIDPDKIKLENLTELHLLWAFGLANKNPILETGPMADPR